MVTKNSRSPSTLTAQAGHYIDAHTGAVVPPIHTATTYARDQNYQLVNRDFQYSRDENPTYDQAERVLADLEGGRDALLFSSGMAAITALFRTLSPGSRVVAPSRMYYGVIKWLLHFSAKNKIQLAFFDPASPNTFATAIESSKPNIVWVETPANPSWDVTDIKRAAALTHDAGAMLAVDSTIATPVLTNPIKLGADIVFHSASKYLNGHSDVIAGVLITNEQNDIWDAVKFDRHYSGAVIGPFESWLLLRGMRTLFVRVQHSSASALAIARHFEKHPALDKVLYPGLESHPAHAVAKSQMLGGFSGMLSFLVKGGAESALRVAKRVHLFTPATSLGGVESLIEHRKSVEGPESLTPENLLRLSIGLEDVNDLIADLEQALEFK